MSNYYKKQEKISNFILEGCGKKFKGCKGCDKVHGCSDSTWQDWWSYYQKFQELQQIESKYNKTSKENLKLNGLIMIIAESLGLPQDSEPTEILLKIKNLKEHKPI